MRAVLHAAVFALMLGTALEASAAQTGPLPSDVIHPRHLEAADARTQQSSALVSAVPRPSTGGALTTAGYVLLLGLLVGGAFYLIKRGSLPRPFARNDGKLQVLETRMLGNRQFLLVVEYDEARMLLGVCPGRIDYLTPLTGHPLMETGAEDGEESVTVPLVETRFGGRR